jgi:phosphoglycerol geranylgeranyltransferase
MRIGKVERYISESLETKGAMLFSLIDPLDYRSPEDAVKTATESARGGADLVLLGGSMGMQGGILDDITKQIKEKIDVPLVIFPGNTSAITTNIDAIYFMSLLNSRNPYWITQAQMLAAPVIRRLRIEPIPVGYIVVAPGGTVGWIGDVNIIPREKPAIAASLAVAGEFMGNKLIITDTGSNPQMQNSGPVPNEMIKMVKSMVSVPYIVAGGIRTADQLREVYSSGADIAQIGTAFEDHSDPYKQAAIFAKVVKEEGGKKIGSR